MPFHRKSWILLLLCCHALFIAHGQDDSYMTDEYVDHIGSEEGLASQLCQHLVEDDHGNLWITSFSHLQKYDGYTVSVLPTEQIHNNDPSLIDLGKDQSGMIWLIQGLSEATIRTRYLTIKSELLISIIEPLSEEVIAFDEYFKNHEITQENLTNLFMRKDAFYMLTNDNKIYKYAKELQFYGNVEEHQNFIGLDKNANFIYFSQGKLLTKKPNGDILNQLDLSQNSQYIFITKNGHIFLFDSINKQVIYNQYESGETTEVLRITDEEDIGRLFYSIEKYQDGQILVNNRLYTSDSQELSFRNTVSNNRVYDYIPSQSGLKYVATNLGVYVIDNKKKIFNQLGKNESRTNSVRGFYLDDKIKAYKDAEVEKIIATSELVDLKFLEGIKLGDLVTMHYKDPIDSNSLWSVGYVKENVRLIDFEKRQLSFFEFDPKRPYDVNCIHRSSITNILYLSSYNGIYHLGENNKIFKAKELECAKDEKVETNHIIEREGQLWIASNQGIIVYDESTGNCVIDSVFSNSIKYTIQFIHNDKTEKDIVWIGTKRGGLIKWNTKTDVIAIFNTENGLSNNDVHAIIEDSQNRLWVSTNKNLNCLDKKTNTISIFTEQDGISHSEFNRYSYYNDTINNHIYFGGINGYTYFCPDSIDTSIERTQVTLRIVDADKIKNDATVEDIFVSASKNNTISFQEEDVALQFNLSTNHLYRTKNIQYSYRIPGLIDEWKAQSSNEIKLNRLPYGNFKLELIADLNKPSLTSNILSLDIDVVKPFKKTWLGRGLGLLTFLFFSWFLVRSYYRNLRSRNTKLEEAISERTKELSELNATKNKIFAILAHDLKNPITSLADITDKIKFLSKHNRLDELDLLAVQTKNKVNALNDNLNNILLWALSENKILTLRPEKLSLLHEIRKILNLYSHQLDQKNITTHIHLRDIDQVYMDISVLQAILRNFISNAIKFSYHDSDITVAIKSESDDHIELEIEDKGIGIKEGKEVIEGDKEKKIREVGKGSGIGLKICNEIAMQSGVDIRIESTEKSGTKVFLKMPKKFS